MAMSKQELLVKLFEELEKASEAAVCNYGMRTVLMEEKLKAIKERYLNDNKDDASN